MAIDKKTIEAMVQQYYKEIYRYCFSRLINKDSVEDVVQNVFLVMQEKSEELMPEHLRAWLYSVAQKKILEERRDEVRRSRFIAYDMDMIAKDSTFICDIIEEENTFDDGDVEAMKTRIIQMLTPEEQRLFEAIYEKHIKRREAAEQFGITENALNVRIYRLKNHIISLAQIVMMIVAFIHVKCK